jgi:hypothetical protein
MDELFALCSLDAVDLGAGAWKQVAIRLNESLGDNKVAWETAVSLLGEGWGRTLDDLLGVVTQVAQ